MATRKLLAFNATDAFHEEIAAADDTALGALVISPGNINMSTTGKVVNLASATTAGDALAYGQSAASLAGLTMTGAIAMGTNKITGMGDPTLAQDAATKFYVDGLINGVSWKPPVLVVSGSDIASLSGLLTTVDGVALNTDGQRVLLTAQSPATENGPWVVHSGAWTRPTDTPVGADAANFSYFVQAGTAYSDTAWVCTTNSPATVDTTALTFVQFSAAGVITAGNGLQQLGAVFSVKPGDGIETTSNTNATNVALEASTPGLQFIGASPNGRLQVKAASNAGLEVVAAGVQIKVDATTAGNPTLAVGANGTRVIGLPSLFNINSVAVSANVTAANLGTLTAGVSSDASSLHTHSNIGTQVRNTYVTVDALASGDPVSWSTTNNQVNKALANTNAKSRVMGVNTNASVSGGASAILVSHGPNTGVLSGATAGTAYFLQATGGIGTSVPGAGNRVVEVGVALNATDLWVRILDFGRKT